MNRGLLVVSVALILFVAAVVIAKAFAATTEPIEVTATLAKSRVWPQRPPGLRGDSVAQTWQVTSREGRTLGRMLLTCRWIVRDARYCVGQVEMPTGVISVAGSSPSRFAGVYVVTGGTGEYLGVGGSMRFTAIGARKTVLDVTITT